jgi:hypothetical protein
VSGARLRLAAALAALALAPAALAGCGGNDESGGGEPEATAAAEPGAGAPAGVPDRVPGQDPGPHGVAVVDLRGRALVRPPRVEFASDASFLVRRWRGWAGPRALATGSVRVLVCRPTCAAGEARTHPGRLTLSEPTECAGRSYYGAARVTYRQRGRARRPASYVEAPC